MTTTTKIIDGCTVTVEPDMGDGASGCWIEKGNLSASLECADALGYFEDDDGRQIKISAGTLLRIRAWAESQGY